MDYCASVKEKREGADQRMKEKRKRKEGAWKAGVVWFSRGGRLVSLGRRRTPILFGPQCDPWPHTCSSLLQVQALTAGSSHADTHYKPIFHTLCMHWGKRHMKMQLLSHFSPPTLLFFFLPCHCLGLKIQTCLSDGVRAVIMFSFFFFFKIFSHQEKKMDKIFFLSFFLFIFCTRCNEPRCVNHQDIMYNYLSVWYHHRKPPHTISDSFLMLLMALNKIQENPKTQIECALCMAHWLKHCKVNEPIYILTAAIWVEWRGWRSALLHCAAQHGGMCKVLKGRWAHFSLSLWSKTFRNQMKINVPEKENTSLECFHICA